MDTTARQRYTSPACKVIAISTSARILSGSNMSVYNRWSDSDYETDEQF